MVGESRAEWGFVVVMAGGGLEGGVLGFFLWRWWRRGIGGGVFLFFGWRLVMSYICVRSKKKKS